MIEFQDCNNQKKKFSKNFISLTDRIEEFIV